MAVESLTPEQIMGVELPTGEPWLYELAPDLSVRRKLVLEGAPA
jgi:bisphosphoglycerate-dependent phosphoglycerate mutase